MTDLGFILYNLPFFFTHNTIKIPTIIKIKNPPNIHIHICLLSNKLVVFSLSVSVCDDDDGDNNDTN